MEAELKSLLKVTASVAASTSYARFASSHIRPGNLRLLSLLPVILFLPILPFQFSTLHLRVIAAFFLAWLAVFKLLLLAFALGPLSPSLPLSTFIFTTALPVKLSTSSIKSTHHSNHLLAVVARLFILISIVSLYPDRRYIPRYILLTLFSLHLYLALSLVLDLVAFVSRTFLNLDLDPQFNAPYATTSLADFWGRRWNLMVTAVLRPAVYIPVRRRWGAAAAVISTFLVSGLMHEVMFYYMAPTWPTWEVTGFFVLQGVAVVVEGRYKNVVGKLAPPVAAGLTVGFVVVTAFWLFFPPVWRSGAEEVVVEECLGMLAAVVAGGRSGWVWVGLGLDRVRRMLVH